MEEGDRRWLLEHLDDLHRRYEQLPAGLPWCAVHGDAWRGNVAVTGHGPVLLDLERFACGPPEWDLTSIAVSHVTFGSMSAEEWAGFSERYGHDVATWDGFAVLLDIRELRKVTFAFQMAEEDRSSRSRRRTGWRAFAASGGEAVGLGRGGVSNTRTRGDW